MVIRPQDRYKYIKKVVKEEPKQLEELIPEVLIELEEIPVEEEISIGEKVSKRKKSKRAPKRKELEFEE